MTYRATPIRRNSLPHWPDPSRPARTTGLAPGLEKGIIMCPIPRIRRQNPAGFWVSRTCYQTARRAWCLSCCQRLGQSRNNMIPFEGHDSAGRSR